MRLIAAIILTWFLPFTVAGKDNLPKLKQLRNEIVVLNGKAIGADDLKAFVQADENYSWQKLNEFHDNKGTIHTRFQQFYRNIEVKDAQIIVHYHLNGTTTLSGEAVTISALPVYLQQRSEGMAGRHESENKENINLTTIEILLKSELLNKLSAVQILNSNNKKIWIWNNETGKHELYCEVINNDESSLIPTEYLIRANDGKLISEKSDVCHLNTSATAVTSYYGIQQITTSENQNTYTLKSNNKGQGIETYNLNHQLNYQSQTEFFDTDNFWELNTNIDALHATDAHFCSEKYYDFLSDKFNINSIDNNGHKLISYLNYGTGLNNAFWNGTAVVYGSGNNNAGPLTTLDIAGHEFTHGLIQKTAALNYSNESGTLNEAIADILGTSLEFYADPTNANWIIAEKSGAAIRSIENPEQYNQPSSYHGTNWYFGTGDNGGVHINSGFINRWFYLLSEGGQGTNENGINFNVTGIGINAATKIVYQTLSAYLVSNSSFEDFYFYTLQSAFDLHGNCTPEYLAVAEAWKAVNYKQGVNTPLVLSLPVNNQFCTGTSVLLGADGFPGSTYTWYKNGIVVYSGVNNFYSATESGNYYVNENRCNTIISSDNINLNTLPLPEVNAQSYQICNGTTVQLSASPAGGIYSVPNPYSGSSTNYTYTFTDNNGCSNTASGNIDILSSPVVQITNENLLVPVNAAVVTLTSNVNGVYSGPGVSGNTFDPANFTPGLESQVHLSYTNTQGCSGYDSVNFKILPPCVRELNNISISSKTINTTGDINIFKLSAAVNTDEFSFEWELNGIVLISGNINGNDIVVSTSQTNPTVKLHLTNTCDEEFEIMKSLTSPLYTNETKLIVFPNPANNQVFIGLEGFDDVENSYIIISDATGKTIKEFIPQKVLTEIELTNFNKGLYLIRVFTPESVISKKLVVN